MWKEELKLKMIFIFFSGENIAKRPNLEEQKRLLLEKVLNECSDQSGSWIIKHKDT